MAELSGQVRQAIETYFTGERAEVGAFLTLSLALLGIGVGLVLGGDRYLKGLGIGLLVFAAVGFVIDHYSETRAHAYSAALAPGART